MTSTEHGGKMNNQEFQDRVLEKLDDLDKRLFRDNGNLSMQSKINKNSRDLKIVTGIFSLLGAFYLSIVTIFIKKQVGE